MELYCKTMLLVITQIPGSTKIRADLVSFEKMNALLYTPTLKGFRRLGLRCLIVKKSTLFIYFFTLKQAVVYFSCSGE